MALSLHVCDTKNCINHYLGAVFDEHVRRSRSSGGSGREMDFESYLDFVLALENKDTSEGLTYLFRCLDLQNRGFLTTVDIHTLFRQMLSIFLYIFLSVVEVIMLLIWLIVRPNHLNFYHSVVHINFLK